MHSSTKVDVFFSVSSNLIFFCFKLDNLLIYCSSPHSPTKTFLISAPNFSMMDDEDKDNVVRWPTPTSGKSL
jgi:hypothetical protein